MRVSTMKFTLVVFENIILFLLIPQALRSIANKTAQTLDDRNMFGVPLCGSIATACATLLAIIILLSTGVVYDAAPARLWGIDGPWHTGRLMVLGANYLSVLAPGGSVEYSATLVSIVKFILAGIAVLTLINGLIAAAGWRSIQAVRGLAVHVILAASRAVIFYIWVLTALWVIHWLNFWIFLVLLCVIEMRRRESGAVRLSF